MLALLPWGWAPLEITYKLRDGEKADDPLHNSRYDDGKVGWASWSIRAQDTLLQWGVQRGRRPDRFHSAGSTKLRARVYSSRSACTENERAQGQSRA